MRYRVSLNAEEFAMIFRLFPWRRRAALITAGLLLSAAALAAQTVSPELLRSQVERQLPELGATYRQLHQHPELSRHEEKTAAFLAAELRKAGFEVTEHVGRYEDGSQATGIVAVMKNGPGPVVLIRTDMDALPVTEATGLEFASHERSQNAEKQDVGVMHACGHDLHMTALIGVAHELAQNRGQWHGTVLLVGQPAEEVVSGARAMMADRFYERFPRPDYILDQHDTNDLPAGHVGLGEGPMLAGAISVDVLFHGVGTHGSRPQAGKDPVLMGAEFVMLAQTVVSRQIAATDPAVLTIGTFHAGTKRNIISDEARLGLSMRFYTDEVRQKLLDGVRRAAAGVATAYGVAADRMPEVTVVESTVPTVNDAALAGRMRKVAERTLGASNVSAVPPVMGSEDVGYFSDGGKIPFVFLWLGAANPEKWAEAARTGVPLPTNHSARFAPDYQPALRTGVTNMTAMAMDLLQ
jgi:hippurate hydrolase